jgi:serine/threonine protein kinase
MSSVYQARSPQNKVAAIKLLDLRKVANKRVLDRFIQEYKLLSNVDHPNIVQVYEQGFTDSHLYIAMELLSNDSLKSRIINSLTVEQALRYAIDLSSALGTIHDMGILHRDIKPNNILFNNDGQPVITDFGIAKLTDQNKDMELTMLGEAVGTPAYMI